LAALFLSLGERENVLLISRAVETMPRARGTCSYEGVETESSLIPLRVAGEPNIIELDGYWISRPDNTIVASPITFGD
jgi:hypothetical protein